MGDFVADIEYLLRGGLLSEQGGVDAGRLIDQGYLPLPEFGERLTTSRRCASDVFPSRFLQQHPVNDVIEWGLIHGISSTISRGSDLEGLCAAEDEVEFGDELDDIVQSWLRDRSGRLSCRMGDFMLIHYASGAEWGNLEINTAILSHIISDEIKKIDAHSGDRWESSGLVEEIVRLWSSHSNI